MKRNPAVVFLALLLIGSVVYETVGTMLDAIGRNWGPQQNDIIARAFAAGIWLASLSIAMVILGFAVQLMGWKFGGSERQEKIVDGEVVNPVNDYMHKGNMLSDDGSFINIPTGDFGNVTYVGLDQYEDAGNGYN